MKKLMTKEFGIGLSVIVALVILFVGIDYLKGINLFKPANFYIVQYDNVSGLEVSAPVNIDGFKVGQVREINFNYENPGKIDVVLALNKSLHLPEDTKAEIGSSLLGGSFVDLKLGSSSRMLEVGSTIQGIKKADMMTSISDELMPKIQRVLPKVDSLLLNLNKLVGDSAIVRSLQNLEGLTRNLQQTSVLLNTMMRRDMPGLLGSAKKVAVNLDSVTSDLSVLSAQLKGLPIDVTVENVNQLTSNLAKFSSQLNNPNSSLGQLMNDPELYNRLNTIAADVDSLIVDIKKNPKRYISIKLL